MVRIRESIVIGVFKDQKHAVAAIEGLRAAKFTEDQIGLVAREWVGGPEPHAVKTQQKAGKGAVGGAVAGAGIGAVAGVLGTALVPGIGWVVAGSLLVGALGGAAMGAAAGTFAGPFLALEMSEEEARHHARQVEEGRTVVLVQTHDRQEAAGDLLLKHGAYDDSMLTAP